MLRPSAGALEAVDAADLVANCNRSLDGVDGKTSGCRRHAADERRRSRLMEASRIGGWRLVSAWRGSRPPEEAAEHGGRRL